MPAREVILTATEMMVGAYVGSARCTQSLFRGWKHAAGAGHENAWTLNIEGAQGEMAAAKCRTFIPGRNCNSSRFCRSVARAIANRSALTRRPVPAAGSYPALP